MQGDLWFNPVSGEMWIQGDDRMWAKLEGDRAHDPRAVCAVGQGVVHLHRWWGGDAKCLNCHAPLCPHMNELGQWVAESWTWIIHEPETITL